MHTILCLLAIAAVIAAGAALAADISSLQGSADQVTRVRVQPPSRNAPRIDPGIFSDFLEHLGGAIYDGLWANAIYNPRFAPDAQGRIARWAFRGGASTFTDPESGTAARLPVGGDAAQLISLPVHRDLRYHGTLRARCVGEGPTTVEISLRAADKPVEIAAARVQIRGSSWERSRFTLAVPPLALTRGESAEVRFSAAGSACEVSMVELFPDDAIDGMDPDIVRAAQDLHIELLRWPGGNFVSGYHWKNGIGPRELRPTLPNPAWSGLETHHFGTDEFMTFCRLIGAKPMICVNAGNGTPEEAADWVEYCNGSADTAMGKLRAENGHRRPYNVRVWEIGNELYGGWQIGHTDPEGNAARFVRFRRAMLSRDPSIETIATGKADQFVGDGLNHDRRWNDAVLTAAAHDGRAPDLLSLHPLVPLPGDLSGRFSYEEIYESAMAHPVWFSQSLAPALRAEIQERARASAPTGIAVTEWGIIVGGPDWLRYPNHDTQSGAVYAALFLNSLMRSASIVHIANVTALLHGGGIKKRQSVVVVDPMYHVQRMYDEARPTRLLDVSTHGPVYDAPQRGFLPAVESVPWVDVVAAESARGTVLFVVNRDPGSARSVEISLPTAAGHAIMETLAADPRARNSFESPDAVRPVRSEIPVSGSTLSTTLPPCSVSVIHLR